MEGSWADIICFSGAHHISWGGWLSGLELEPDLSFRLDLLTVYSQ